MAGERKYAGLNRPFLLKPAAKDYLWGGNRLNTDFAKGIDAEPLAETWECSTHPDGPSVVASGEFAGMLLGDVLKANPNYLGLHYVKADGELPILIKFIDAKRDLSVQVHPSDEYAAEFENGQLGKSEMWYVLDAAEETKLVYGFEHAITPEILRESVADGSIVKHLKRVSIHKGDVFFIQAGLVHGVGAGALVAEIQENSNLTYRIFDYNRPDKDGKIRELHIDKAIDVADLSAATEPVQAARPVQFSEGCATELVCRCKYFEAYRMQVQTQCTRKMVSYRADGGAFRVLLCMEGCGTMFFGDEVLPFFKGDCVFVPAASVEIRIHGDASLLDVRG